MHDDTQKKLKDTTVEHTLMASKNYDMDLFFSVEGGKQEPRRVVAAAVQKATSGTAEGFVEPAQVNPNHKKLPSSHVASCHVC